MAKKTSLPKHYTQDDQWLLKNLEKLVDQHGGKYVIIANGEAFIGKDAAALETKARKKHPGVVPTGMPIPRPEDFTCAL